MDRRGELTQFLVRVGVGVVVVIIVVRGGLVDEAEEVGMAVLDAGDVSLHDLEEV